ncbi:hypothetical protein MHL31_02770 [Lutibacter sp. A80]|uniref:NifB/NifX family molybdenum-iron cluster-binding protein n=1 Tax=Lutibacter sp. A80 TaxID=2918453 RepID=UPI001F05F869|nr:NifB/NifX family molybdenum-iron cluster-binding protein [Lutibacter sp. A80]UMB61135.1 hypothetical protein MHL31_02770 [Lutibacter sp. A80]
MKNIVAVTFQNKKSIFNHTGKCRNYLIYTINGAVIEHKRLLELSRDETLRNFFQNESNKHVLLECDILLTRGIGSGATEKLAKYGVACYKIDETDPDIAIQKLINGTLEAMAPISNELSGCNCNCNTKKH